MSETLFGMNPFVLTIFGATGDLARNKLFPSLFSLFIKKQLGEKFFIIGFSRRELSRIEFNELIRSELENKEGFDPKTWDEFSKNIHYQAGLFDEKKGYEELIPRLKAFDDEIGACITRVFYLATPPDNYEMILTNLSETKLSEGCGQGSDKWTRIAIEKPFGKDLDTAKHLDTLLATIFDEKQIFRVDHYLGKETVQNMLAFRFANGIFEPIWNKQYIDHVQITFAEKKGVEGRGMFFDGVGMLRDVMQNHLLQLVAAVAMEQPSSFSKEGVRDARAQAIKAIRTIKPDEVREYVVAGQYDGYTAHDDVPDTTNTETFTALKLFVDTKRFEDVPFYIRAGKHMPENIVEIKIIFIQTCHLLFKEYGCPEIGNVLTIRIQPDEGIHMQVLAKKPGTTLALGTVNMQFTYEKEFGEKGADAYEKLLVDIFMNDQMLFNRSDELQSSWTFITNILKGWALPGTKVHRYKEGTWGPKESNELIERDGRKWI